MKRNKVFFLVVLILLISGMVTFYLNKKDKEAVLPDFPFDQEEKNIFDKARERYMLWRERGTDFAAGPCLGEIGEGWVVDIVHFPKTADDEMPQNQCPELLTGKAKHVIELNDNGDFINMK